MSYNIKQSQWLLLLFWQHFYLISFRKMGILVIFGSNSHQCLSHTIPEENTHFSAFDNEEFGWLMFHNALYINYYRIYLL